MLEERAVEVSASMRAWIDDVRVASMTGEQMVLDEPDAATTLVLRKVPGAEPELVVMGPRTQALYYLGRPGPELDPAVVGARHRGRLLRPLAHDR